MKVQNPATELQSQYSSPEATPTAWADACELLEKAEIFWLSTVRPDGHPHVTPMLSIWLDGMLYFSTGPNERKAQNLAQNAQCVITTGTNALNEGLDLVVEGKAVQIRDEDILQRLAALYGTKYGWHFSVRNGTFFGVDGEAIVFAVTPTTAFGFGKGTFSQTRWRF